MSTAGLSTASSLLAQRVNDDVERTPLPELSGRRAGTLRDLCDAEAIAWLDDFTLSCTTRPDAVRQHVDACLRGFQVILKRKRLRLDSILSDASTRDVRELRVTASPVVSAVLQALVNLNKVVDEASWGVVAALGGLVVELASLVGLQRKPNYSLLPPSIVALIDTAAISARSVLRSAAHALLSPATFSIELLDFVVGCIIRFTKFLGDAGAASSPPAAAAIRAYVEEFKLVLICLEGLCTLSDQHSAATATPRGDFRARVSLVVAAVEGLLTVVGKFDSSRLAAIGLKRAQVLVVEDFLARVTVWEHRRQARAHQAPNSDPQPATTTTATDEATNSGSSSSLAQNTDAAVWAPTPLETDFLDVDAMVERMISKSIAERTSLTTQEALKIMAAAKRECELRCQALSETLASRLASNQRRSVQNNVAASHIAALRESLSHDAGNESETLDSVARRIELLEQRLAVAREEAFLGSTPHTTPGATPADRVRRQLDEDLELMTAKTPPARGTVAPLSPF